MSRESAIEMDWQHYPATAGWDELIADGAPRQEFAGLARYLSNIGIDELRERQRAVDRLDARELLRNGIAPADVALRTGYADQSHLTRHFRRLVGVTPGQYARSCSVARLSSA